MASPVYSLVSHNPTLMASELKILDAGANILFSGATYGEVEAALARYVDGGSKVITPTSQVGQAWVAACTVPKATLDDTQTLRLAEFKLPAAPKPPPEPTYGCRVEEVGLKRIVYGPSEAAVQLRVAQLMLKGAALVAEPEEAFGEWVAVCDTGGVQQK